MPPEPTPTPEHRSERCQGRDSAESARGALTEGASRGATLPVGSGGWLWLLGAPWGAAGARAPRAADGSRAGFAAEGEHGDGAGVGGGRTPKQGARRSQAQAARLLRLKREAGDPPHAQCSPARGVGGLPQRSGRCLAAPQRRSGTPGRRGIRPAVTRSRERRRQAYLGGCKRLRRPQRSARGLAAPREAGAPRRRRLGTLQQPAPSRRRGDRSADRGVACRPATDPAGARAE